jgi:hypothetical protein
MFSNENQQNSSTCYSCEKCNYITVRKFNYEEHLLTSKHQKSMTINENPVIPVKSSNHNFHCQICNKVYKDNSGLWRHKKKCIAVTNDDSQDQTIEKKDEIINILLKENQDFKNLILEIIKKDTITNNNNNNNINNINSHNKSFNLNFFLNETCKDAMNIMDFVNSLKIELSDLENVGNVGYVNGISSIIVKNLNLLDETKRPVHCADTKREVMYVKDDNKWEKDNENKSQMRKIIKHATHKNSKLLKEYKAKYPGCEKSESKYSYAYDKLIVETFGGKGDDEIGKENKIIRNIAKNVTISKDNF